MNEKTQTLIQELNLEPHPEGGFYKEVYRSSSKVKADDRSRSALTSIYFLLPEGVISRWHIVKSDEVWIHLEGAPLELVMYDESNNQSTLHLLGSKDQHPPKFQATVPANIWQAARSMGDYSLVTCLVGPGFDFEDFEMMEKDSARSKAWAESHSILMPYI